MLTISLAGLVIGLDTQFEYTRRACAPFGCAGTPAFCVSVTEQALDREQQLTRCRREIAEFTCLYRGIAERLPDYDRFVLHGATVQTGGKAFIFTAKSGTGKSTHLRLWQQRYGAAVSVVNGDKPVIWKRDGVWYACGTPWCGKEKLTSTDCVPVGGLCFLERAGQNTIRPAVPGEIAERIMHQIYRPQDTGRLLRFLALLDEFLTATPCWQMGCNMELSAAETSFAAMTGAEPAGD